MTPIVFAVFRLITSWNCVGSSTGRSPALAPLKDLVDVFGGMSVLIREVWRVAYKATEFRKLDKIGDRGQPICCREFGHALELDEKDRVSDEENAIGPLMHNRCKDIVEVGDCSYLQGARFEARAIEPRSRPT